MATKRDVEFAQNGETSQESSFQQSVVDNAVADVSPSARQGDFVIFKLVNSSKKGGTYIPNIDEVIDPTTGNLATIRLLRGVTSIWLKDQKDVTPAYASQNGRSLNFPRGAKCLRIPVWDKAALEFATICRHNIGAPNRKSGSKFEFFEYNPAKAASEALDRELLELEMAIVVKDLDEAQIRKLAAFVTIGFNDEVGEPKTPDLIKRELMLYAKRNPHFFKQLVTDKSKEVELSFQIKKNILAGKIDVASQQGKAFWANGGGLIGVIPNGDSPARYLVELAQTNTENGRLFLEQLKNNPA